MSMDSTRRPFDRSLSKEPGVKKPRLNEGPSAPDRVSNGRGGFFHRPIPSNSGGSRAQRDRSSEGGDPLRGAYQPQPTHQLHQELVTQYRTALSELTFNSKPIITNLTIIAGESLQAARAIAGTICSNIIEVPREQKLPSLYLLDSIVKNIGSDYIKYFAPRLPEVFIKAYRQVDPSVHSGMRHLFGTWKGVFPLQTLQLIEKELGFTDTPNGSSAAATTSRPESQAHAQRPAHSIHVNPKYLEARQRLQTIRARGASSDTSEGLLSSHEEVEEAERTPSISSGKSWIDPYAKPVQSHHLRDQVTEPVRGKHPNASYSESEYGSILPGRSGLRAVRATEKVQETGYDKPWYTSSSDLAGLSRKKNGFGLKHRLENLHEPAISDSAPHFKENVASTNSNGMSGDWKNSEEEEYMWEEMNSRPTGGTSDEAFETKDHWAPVNSDRLDIDTHLQRSQIMHDIGSRDEDEVLDDSISMELSQVATRTQLPVWSQKSKLPEGRVLPVTGKSIPSYSERYLPGKGSQSSLGKSHSLSKLDPTHIGVKNSTNSTRSVLSSQNPKNQLLNNFTERNKTSSINLPTDHRRPPGRKTMVPHDQVPEDICSIQRVQTQNLQSSSSAILPPIQQKKRAPSAVQPRKNIKAPELKTSGQLHKLPGSESPPAIESPGKSITSGLFDALGRSGIQTSTTIPGGFTKPVSQKKEDLANGPSNAVSSTSNPVSSLLSSLVAKGLISSSSSLKSDSVLSVSPIKSPRVSSPVTSSKPSIPIKDEPSSSEPESLENIKNLIGFEFRQDIIRNLHPDVISYVSSEAPHQCSICGLRLKLEESLDRHMEWHALKVPDDNNNNNNNNNKSPRSWYPSLVDWVARIGQPEMITDDEMVEFCDPMVPADENQCACILCGELFEDVYSHERDEWMFKGAVYLTEPSKCDAALVIPVVHADCLSEDSVCDLGMVCDVKLEMDS